MLAWIQPLSPIVLGLIIISGAWWALGMYKRGDVARAKGWFLVILALGAPWFMATILGLTVDHMKSTEFCASCHIMQPYHHDLHDLKTDGLAGKHFQNNWVPKGACYSCHTDYGPLGGVMAKVSGMHHVYNFYVKGQKDNPRLLKPYNNMNCLQCHGGDNRRYKAESAHEENAEEILSGATSCVECHSPVHNTEEISPEKFLGKKSAAKGGKHESVSKKR